MSTPALRTLVLLCALCLGGVSAKTLILVGPLEIHEGGGRDRHDIISVGSDVLIPMGQTNHDVHVILGDLTVNGTVEGDLISVMGEVKLGPTARIEREMVVVGGPLEADPESVTDGFEGPRLTLPPWFFKGTRDWARSGLLLGRPLSHHFGLGWWIAGSFFMLYLLLALFFPAPVGACVRAVGQRPASSFAAGVLALILIGPLVALLAASVVGVLVIPLVMGAACIALVLGKVAIYRCAGEHLGLQSGLGFLQNPMIALITGMALFCILYMVPILGFLVWGLAGTTGLGCVVLATFDAFKRENPPGVSDPRDEGIPVSAEAVTPTMRSRGDSTSTAGITLMPRAGFWIRLAATTLDLILIGAVAAVLETNKIQAKDLFMSFWLVYHLSLWSWRGTTVGGIVCGLKILRTNGQPLPFGVALIRLLSAFFSALILFLGFLWVGWNREKRSWHDLIAGTVIVRVPKGRELI